MNTNAATMPTMTDDLRFVDFSLAPEGPVFRIAPDDFHCVPEIPLDVMLDIARFAQSESTGMDRMQQMVDLFTGVIVPEDYDTFINRTKRATKEVPNPHPIGMRHIRALLPWIMEVYGLRPTRESSASSDGSPDESINSTEPVSDVALTS